MCSAYERSLIEALLSELSISAEAVASIVLAVHQGKLCHLTLQVRFSVQLCPDDRSGPECRDQHVHLPELSQELQARLQRLVVRQVGKYGKLEVRFGGGDPPCWDFVKMRKLKK